MTDTVDLSQLAEPFLLEGRFLVGQRYGQGHIHETYLSRWREPNGAEARYLHQRLNPHVFPAPAPLMENIQRVTQHLHRVLRAQGVRDPERRALRIIPTRDGHTFHRDARGDVWRTYPYVEGTVNVSQVEHPDQAFAAGAAFGRFQDMLRTLPPPRLHDTIPWFHHTPRRLQALLAAVRRDAMGRAAECREEIAYAEAQARLVNLLQDLVDQGRLPERVVHNDTKINNVLLDADTGEGICIIDLDTVMPGLVHHDFGDLVRTATCPAAEDERDLSQVRVDPLLLEQVTRGYCSTADAFLTDEERRHLPAAGPLITLETGIRFLTDHLEGDHYFRTSRPAQNRDRARVQFRLVDQLLEPALQEVVRRAAAGDA